jgi:hypothetical protein
LAYNECGLERDFAAKKMLPVKLSGREWSAEGIHTEIGSERREDGLGNKDGLWRSRQQIRQSWCAEAHFAAIATRFIDLLSGL